MQWFSLYSYYIDIRHYTTNDHKTTFFEGVHDAKTDIKCTNIFMHDKNLISGDEGCCILFLDA